MNKSTTIGGIIAAILIIALIAWMLVRDNGDVASLNGNENATSTVTGGATSTSSGGKTSSPSGNASPSSSLLESYTNATHNFTVSFPRELNAEPFGNFHRLNQNDWRYAATAAYRGTPVISVPVVRIDNQAKNLKNYPFFYGAEVRIGVSTDVTNCYAKDDGYTNQTVSNVTIGGVTWKKFSFGDAAMQQYVNGASYRTVRNNKCYVIEQIENGSSYRDETLVGGYSDADLRAFYAKTNAIVMSFRFTK